MNTLYPIARPVNARPFGRGLLASSPVVRVDYTAEDAAWWASFSNSTAYPQADAGGDEEIAVELAEAASAWERAEDRRRSMDRYGRVPQAVCDAVLDAVEAAEDRLRGLTRAGTGRPGRAVLVGGKVIIDLSGLRFDEGLPDILVLDAAGVGA